MSELVQFAAKLIEASGGLAEATQDRVTAVLGERLSERLQLPEEVVIAPSATPGGVVLTYGSDLLERLLGVATDAVAWAAVRLRLDPPAPNIAERAAARFVLRNGVSTPGSARVTTGTRVVAHALLTLEADEQRRRLVSAAVSRRTLTPVVGFAGELSPTLLDEQEGRDPAGCSAELSRVLVRACWHATEESLASFAAQTQQRYERERQRLYRQAGEPPNDETELRQRYRQRAELRPVALLEVEAPVLLCDVTLRRRKAERRFELEYDAATRALVPPRCDACGGAAQRPAACDDAFHLLCEECLPSSSGRPRCPVCG
jgi:hypothetical protein